MRKQPGEAYRRDHLHFDHLTPWAMGGSDEADNIVISCAGCNLARVRPARGSAAENRLLWRIEGDEFYWRDSKYRPPQRVGRDNPDVLFTPAEAADLLERRVMDVLVLVSQGVLLATSGVRLPIRVAFPGFFSSFIDERMDALGWVADE